MLGLQLDEITAIIQCGSRGFGYQVCDDCLGVMESTEKKPHRTCPTGSSPAGRSIQPKADATLARCGARSITPLRTGKVITHHTRKAFEKALGMSAAEVGLRTVYEVGLIRLQTTSTESQSFCLRHHSVESGSRL